MTTFRRMCCSIRWRGSGIQPNRDGEKQTMVGDVMSLVGQDLSQLV
jgi:hypothetical protein